MFLSKESPEKIIQDKGLIQITDNKIIEDIIDKILMNNMDKVKQYKAGKSKLLGYFVGQIMQESKGKVSPKILNEILNKKLKHN